MAASIGVGIAAALLLVRGLIFKALHRWAARTETHLDDLIIKVSKGPSLFWALAAGLYGTLETAPIPGNLTKLAHTLLSAVVILSVSWAVANLLAGLITYYADRVRLDVPVTGLGRTLTKVIVLLLGGFILLNNLGISITPLLTALGVGGLAVALALQDTLSNLFAGLHILIEKPVRVGDYIRLDSGQEGYVVDIGWRTTRIRMLPNNMIIVPNSKLAQAIVTNYDLPEKRMALSVPISVSYKSDPEQIERILVEEAKKAAGEVPGLRADPPPFVRFIPGFGDSSLDFTLICQVEEFVDQYLVQHELRKRIFRRFKEEGVEIPFPQRTVHLRYEERKEEETGGRSS
ncbi:MAG: mechanosensitive ion channel [candidate division NC10 bacterium]|nr:mechanosensitive ion channel [candidate division NC10 bacterium]